MMIDRKFSTWVSILVLLLGSIVASCDTMTEPKLDRDYPDRIAPYFNFTAFIDLCMEPRNDNLGWYCDYNADSVRYAQRTGVVDSINVNSDPDVPELGQSYIVYMSNWEKLYLGANQVNWDVASIQDVLDVGRAYDFFYTVNFGYWHSYPSVLVTDSAGLVMYGFTDYRIDEKGIDIFLPDAWEISYIETEIDKRVLLCESTEKPIELVFKHNGNEVKLLQGQSAQLDGYEITVQVAAHQDETPNQRADSLCAHLEEIEVSYTIVRLD